MPSGVKYCGFYGVCQPCGTLLQRQHSGRSFFVPLAIFYTFWVLPHVFCTHRTEYMLPGSSNRTASCFFLLHFTCPIARRIILLILLFLPKEFFGLAISESVLYHGKVLCDAAITSFGPKIINPLVSHIILDFAYFILRVDGPNPCAHQFNVPLAISFPFDVAVC